MASDRGPEALTWNPGTRARSWARGSSNLSERPIDDRIDETVETSRRRGSLTEKQQRFIAEVVENPGQLRNAAIRAGYAEGSAGVTASKLMRHPVIRGELARHFVDRELLLSESLTETLVRLQGIVQEGATKDFLKAAKLLLDYTRLATGVLGLQVKGKEENNLNLTQINVGVDELIETHKAEIRRLERLGAIDAEVVSGEEEVSG